MIWTTLASRGRRATVAPHHRGSGEHLRTSAAATRRLHLGCGLESLGHGAKVLPGWTNIDIEGDQVRTFAWDLTSPFPIPNHSIDCIYSEHFIEHISLADGAALLAECRRVLVPGGVVRLSTPDLRVLVEKYLAGETGEWRDMGWEPGTACDLLNEGLRNWGHLYVYDEPKLIAALEEAGFAHASRCQWGVSTHAPLRGLETRPNHGDLIVEGTA
jgi:predicted SAM-dependent methyltransferase